MTTERIPCPNCSSINRSTAKFCAGCGGNLVELLKQSDALAQAKTQAPETGSPQAEVKAGSEPVPTTPSPAVSEEPASSADEEKTVTVAELAAEAANQATEEPAAGSEPLTPEPIVSAEKDTGGGKTAYVQPGLSRVMSVGRVMNNRYTILRPLGKGGMGAVYLASETIANRQRQVVLKEMLEYYDPNDPEGETKARQRFESEAATLVSLNFSGIPQIFDFFIEGRSNYIVMQFVEGKNLESGLTHLDEEANLIPGEPYPVTRVRQWGIQICKVLENLASQNIVHMDIKPPNLILDRSGDVWLVDFGTAKAQWVMAAGTGQLGMQKSSIYGTIGFAPPEQYTGKAEPRSDVYALAATMYHLMTNDDPRRHPFSFPKIDELPADIAATLKRALEKDVEKRVTAADFRQMLSARTERFSASQPAFLWEDGTASADPGGLVEPANRNWQEAVGYVQGDAWEKWFRALHRNDLLSELVDIKEKYKVASNPRQANPALDAFLRFLDPKLPPPQLSVEEPSIQAGSVQRDNRKIVELKLHNQGGGWLAGRFTGLPPWVQMDSAEFGFHTEQVVKINVNPARLAPRSQPYTASLAAEAGDAGTLQLPLEVTVRTPHWYNSLIGRLAVLLGVILLIFSALALIELRWLGLIVPRFNPYVQGTFRYGILFTSTRDGKVDIYDISRSGTNRITRTSGKGESWLPMPDPLHGGVLFTSNRNGKREIYRLSSSGTERVTVTPGEAESWSAVSEPGGSILFTSDRDGKSEIYRLTTAGETQRLTNTPGDGESWDAVPVWNGDILFTSNRDGKSEIYRMTADGATTRLTDTPGDAESVSPVMQLSGDILFSSNRDGKWEIYRLAKDGSISRITDTGGSGQSWCVFPELGGNLLFISDRSGKREIYRLVGTEAIKVTSTSGEGESYFSRCSEPSGSQE